MTTAAVVLAAGRGTRFRSEEPKVLHRAAGRSMLRHVLEALRPHGLAQVVVVVGHGRDAVAEEAAAAGVDRLDTVVQERQLGTGHAAETALQVLGPDVDRVVVLPGDAPLLTADAVGELLALDAPVAMLTTRLADPTGYGRVLRAEDGGRVVGIVEEADASDEQRAVGEVNAGMYAFDLSLLAGALAEVDAENAQGERYLTDVVGIAVDRNAAVAATVVDDELVRGCNDRVQLADAAGVLRRRHLEALGRAGVTVVDPAATWVDVDVVVGQDTVLLPGTVLESGTRIGARCEVGPHTRLVACEVGDDATVTSSHATEAVVGDRATVGPFAHLRPGTRLGTDTKAGAFTQLKNSTVGDGSKVPHLAYVGDADVGRGVNIGCGVTVVNYDGRAKHRTTVEDGAFVGSGSELVAPLTVGRNGYVAAGSVITEDVPADALAIGRARQVVKEGWAAEHRGPPG